MTNETPATPSLPAQTPAPAAQAYEAYKAARAGFDYHVTLTDERIALLVKAIGRLDSFGRGQLEVVRQALKELERGRRLIIYRDDAKGDVLRLEASREKREAERVAHRSAQKPAAEAESE